MVPSHQAVGRAGEHAVKLVAGEQAGLDEGLTDRFRRGVLRGAFVSALQEQAGGAGRQQFQAEQVVEEGPASGGQMCVVAGRQ
jgi:hypothetical protein